MANILHSKQTLTDGIHGVISYEYADSTARLAATGFTAEDLYKQAIQLDDDSIYVLIDYATPTWQQANTLTLSDATPENLGTAAAGTSGNVSRSDHVHLEPDGIRDIDYIFTPEINTTASSWTALNRFIFPGTDKLGTPTNFKCVYNVENASYPGDIRVYDATNSNRVSRSNGNIDTDYTILDIGGIQNLPTAESMFEVQMRVPTGGGLYLIYMYSLHILF
jgi:hypothetical protein